MSRYELGARVRCLMDGYGNGFTKGVVYTIGGKFYPDEDVPVERDDNGRPNGWVYAFFELVEAPIGPW